MSKKRASIPPSIIALGLVSFFTDAATEMIYPLIPVFVSFLGCGAVVLGVIEGVAETTASLLKLFGGIISDRKDKRKVFILIGYSISSLVRPFTGLVTSAWQIVAVRMFDRAGKGIRTAPRDALIASSADLSIRGKAYGFHRAMDHAGAVAGPFLAVFVLVVLFFLFPEMLPVRALRITFFLALVPGLLAMLTIIFFVRENSSSEQAPGSGQSISFKFLNKNFIRYLAVISLFTFGNSSDAFLLYRVMESINQSQVLSGISEIFPFLKNISDMFLASKNADRMAEIFYLPFFWAFFHVLKSVLSTPLSALSDRIGRKKIICTGWIIYAAVYAGFAFADNVSGSMNIILFAGLFALYAFYYAFTEGTEKAFVSDIVPDNFRGSAFGAYNFAIGIFALPASILFGILYSSFGAMPAFLFGAITAVLSTAGIIIFVKEKKE